MFRGGSFQTSFPGWETFQVSGWEINQKKNICSWKDLECNFGPSKHQGKRPIIASDNITTAYSNIVPAQFSIPMHACNMHFQPVTSMGEIKQDEQVIFSSKRVCRLAKSTQFLINYLILINSNNTVNLSNLEMQCLLCMIIIDAFCWFEFWMY